MQLAATTKLAIEPRRPTNLIPHLPAGALRPAVGSHRSVDALFSCAPLPTKSYRISGSHCYVVRKGAATGVELGTPASRRGLGLRIGPRRHQRIRAAGYVLPFVSSFSILIVVQLEPDRA
jgi:hypothetical protein